MNNDQLQELVIKSVPDLAKEYLHGPIASIGVSRKKICDRFEGLPYLIFSVDTTHKDFKVLDSDYPIPKKIEVEGKKVEVQIVEQIGSYEQFQVHGDRERPAKPGASIGDIAKNSSGTFGAVVTRGNQNFGLSSNHVFRRSGLARNPEVVQPSKPDAEARNISEDNRRWGRVFVQERAPSLDALFFGPLSLGTQATINPHDGVPRPSKDRPAVGLLVAGLKGANKTYYSKITSVLSQLNVTFPEPDSTIEPREGMEIVKTGRSTGRTEGIIDELGAAVNLGSGIVLTGGFIAVQRASKGDSGAIAIATELGIEDDALSPFEFLLENVFDDLLHSPVDIPGASTAVSASDRNDFNQTVFELMERANKSMKLKVGATSAIRDCKGTSGEQGNPEPCDLELIDGKGNVREVKAPVSESSTASGGNSSSLDFPGDDVCTKCCTFGKNPKVTIQGFDHSENVGVKVGPVVITIDLSLQVKPVSGTFFRLGNCHRGKCGNEKISGTAKSMVILKVKFKASAPIKFKDLEFLPGSLEIKRNTSFPFNVRRVIPCNLFRKSN